MTGNKRVTRYRNYNGVMDPDPEGQWVHVGDVGISDQWMLDPAAAEPPASADVDAAWEAMYADIRACLGNSASAATHVADHRPAIEAAIRADERRALADKAWTRVKTDLQR